MPFVAGFGFLLPVLVFVAPMSVSAFCYSSLLFAAFRCFSLPIVALSGFSLLFMSAAFHRPELKQINEDGNKKCSLLLFVACCSFLLVLVFEIESVLSQKPK